MTTLYTLKRVSVPKVALVQRCAFGILCALEIPQPAAFRKWANGWLKGTDRSAESAYAARTARAKSIHYYAASATGKPLNLIALAERAMTY